VAGGAQDPLKVAAAAFVAFQLNLFPAAFEQNLLVFFAFQALEFINRHI
jgi:hypothetical protein